MDLTHLWDFDDAAGSERRFRTEAARAGEPLRSILLTQAARAVGLQGRFTEADALLDDITARDAEVHTRVLLERGRLRLSSGDASGARGRFEAAAMAAADAGLTALHVDAAHMTALTFDGEERVAATLAALDLANSYEDPPARAWRASLLNNLGVALGELDRWEQALPILEEARDLRAAQDGPGSALNAARWLVARALRGVGRNDEALAAQRALKDDLDAVGVSDEYVAAEISILTQSEPPPD